MHANDAKNTPRAHWDEVNVEYPVRKYPETGVSSQTIAHRWRSQPEVVRELRTPIEEIKNYFHDYNITKQLTSSQSTQDYGFKLSETRTFNKHTSCFENRYIYPPSRQIEDGIPQCCAHGTSEMRAAFIPPATRPRLVTEKDQFKHPTTLATRDPPTDRTWCKELEPLDTTYGGYEKYLDPYLTTSRLYHRPYTADQLKRSSNSKDIVTFYTFKNVPWTRTPKPTTEWRLPLSIPKSIYDREKFKQDVREIRVRDKMQWVPGSFRTETRDNYLPTLLQPMLQPKPKIHNYEEEAQSFYKKSLANLSTNTLYEQIAIEKEYVSENSIIGSRKPVCSVLDQFIEKNKRLDKTNVHIG